MTELDEMVKKFDAISKSFGSGLSNPQLKIMVRHNWSERESHFYASFEGCWIGDGDGCASGSYSNGATPEEAMKNYLNCITGKQLIYNINTEREKCVVVI